MNKSSIKWGVPHSGVSILKGLAVIGMVLGLSGCQLDKPDIKQWMSNIEDKEGDPIEPIPEIKEFEQFKYVKGDRRDPFIPPVVIAEEEEGVITTRPDPDRPREPLEEFALDSLMFVGTIGSGSGDQLDALIMDPTKVVHRVAVGQYLGKQDGKILAIDRGKVSLRELYVKGKGFEEKEAALLLTTAGKARR